MQAPLDLHFLFLSVTSGFHLVVKLLYFHSDLTDLVAKFFFLNHRNHCWMLSLLQLRKVITYFVFSLLMTSLTCVSISLDVILSVSVKR